MRWTICKQVIPATFPPDRPAIHNVIARLRATAGEKK